jgi:hypothetical protein
MSSRTDESRFAGGLILHCRFRDCASEGPDFARFFPAAAIVLNEDRTKCLNELGTKEALDEVGMTRSTNKDGVTRVLGKKGSDPRPGHTLLGFCWKMMRI